MVYHLRNPAGDVVICVKHIDFLDIREYNIKRILDIRELEVSHVARAKFQTLTEQMFYTLLCLAFVEQRFVVSRFYQVAHICSCFIDST